MLYSHPADEGQAVRDLAGYSFGRSDLVRRAMSKKKAAVMAKERQNFVYGNAEEGVPGYPQARLTPAAIAPSAIAWLPITYSFFMILFLSKKKVIHTR